MNKKAVFMALILSVLVPIYGRALAAEPGTDVALHLTSPVFQNGQPIPSKYTCDGQNVSPPLTWGAAPPNTKSWALVCEDPDAPKGTFTHWVIYGIPAAVTQLAEGASARPNLPTGAKEGLNDFKKPGYGGPCPPPGKPHRYSFTLYALDREVVLKPKATKKDLRGAIDKHVLGEATLLGTYQRKR